MDQAHNLQYTQHGTQIFVFSFLSVYEMSKKNKLRNQKESNKFKWFIPAPQFVVINLLVFRLVAQK